MKSYFIFYSSLFLLLIGTGCGNQEDFFVSQNSRPVIQPSPTSPTSSIKAQQNTISHGQTFNQKNIAALAPLSKNRTLYYLKNGNIWTARAQDIQTVTPMLFFDAKEDILAFAVSPDQQLVAYSINRYPTLDYSADNEYGDGHGNAIIIRNISEGSEFEVYKDPKMEHLQIRDLKFTSDSKKLVFSNDAIWVADLVTKMLTHYAEKEPQGLCNTFYITDLSPDNKHVLSQLGCMEGGHQIVVNIQNGTIESRFDNGYVEGGVRMLGFISNNSLFGYDDHNPGLKKTQALTFGMYTTSGQRSRIIKTSTSLFQGGFGEKYSGLDFHQHPWIKFHTTNTLQFYKLDSQRLTLQPLEKQNEVLTVSSDYSGEGEIWLRTTEPKDLIFIDRGSFLVVSNISASTSRMDNLLPNNRKKYRDPLHRFTIDYPENYTYYTRVSENTEDGFAFDAQEAKNTVLFANKTFLSRSHSFPIISFRIFNSNEEDFFTAEDRAYCSFRYLPMTHISTTVEEATCQGADPLIYTWSINGLTFRLRSAWSVDPSIGWMLQTFQPLAKSGE